MLCRRSHTLYRTDSRCRALSRNISHCLSAGTASDHLLDVFRSSAGCRRRFAGARRKERRGRVGTPTRHSSGSGRPGRLRQSPTHQAQAFGASRRPVSNSDTLLMRPSAGRPAGWSAGTRRVKSQAVASRPAESRIPSSFTSAAPGPVPLHPRSTRPDPAASPQRPLPHFPVGKIFRVKGGMRSGAPRPKLF